MSSITPTYIPSPNWDIPADSDIVVLGRLIKDAKNPESKIPKSSSSPIPPPKIHEGEKTDWRTNLERVHSGKIGIWAKCLQAIGGQLSFTQLQSAAEDHEFDVLETKYFLPDDDYLAQAVNDPGVQAYFQVCNWRKPVYLITGIKIARGSKVTSEKNTERSAQAEIKVDATGLGVPVEVGPEAAWESKKKSGISFAGSTDYIFAYQLMRIKPKRKGAGSKNESYVRGAVFDKEESGNAAEVALRDVYDVLEETDVGFFDTWESIETGN